MTSLTTVKLGYDADPDVSSSGEYCATSDSDTEEYSAHALQLDDEADENILKNVDSLLQVSTPLYEGCGVSMMETMLLILRFSLRYIL